MTDRPRIALPDFTPVPRRRNRRDGWTPERQRGFVAALAETGSVPAAARAVGMTPEGAYQLRRQPGAETFAAAWTAALDAAARATPPPRLPPMTMQQLMLILRNHASRRAAERQSDTFLQ